MNLSRRSGFFKELLPARNLALIFPTLRLLHVCRYADEHMAEVVPQLVPAIVAIRENGLCILLPGLKNVLQMGTYKFR